MSPRPVASRGDASAVQFLTAGAQLIDYSLAAPEVERPVRLRQIHFPAALEWLRVEDVVRLVQDRPGGSRRAFHQRWPTRDEYLQDLVVFAAGYRDMPEGELVPLLELLPEVVGSDTGDKLAAFAHEFLLFCEARPRTLLIANLAGHLDHHPTLLNAFTDMWLPARQPLVQAMAQMLDRIGAKLRPEWTVDRVDRVLQALQEGFTIQGRTQPDHLFEEAWGHAHLFAEAVVTFVTGALDVEGSSRTARQVLNGVWTMDDQDQGVRASATT